MSRSERPLRVETDNPQADILITDHSLAVVARGASPLQVRLPVGIYGAKVKVGDEEVSTLFKLAEAEDELHVQLGSPLFTSPIPELHRSDAMTPWGAAAGRKGDSQVRLLVNDKTVGDILRDEEARRLLLSRFRLLDGDGEMVAGFTPSERAGVPRHSMAGIATHHAAACTLAFKSYDRVYCISLPRAAGNDLHCYVDLAPSKRVKGMAQPDLAGMAIRYSAHGEERDAEVLRAAESLRIGMVEGRSYAGTRWLAELGEGKHFDAMAALYAAHLQLEAKQPDLNLTRQLMERLAAQLGGKHPDVIALRCEMLRRSGGGELALADVLAGLNRRPILARSWTYLLRPPFELAPSNSIEMLDNTLYLSWLQPRRSPVRRLVRTLDAALDRFSAKAGRLAGLGQRVENRINWIEGSPGLPDLPDLPPRPAPRTDAEIAALLREVAQQFPWRRILKAVLRHPEMTETLQGMPLDLLAMLRDAAEDEMARQGLTAEFVQNIVARTRTPLAALESAVELLVKIARQVPERTPPARGMGG